ncbi:MAG: CgeB family protein [Peptostreptococcaceae bacterium]
MDDNQRELKDLKVACIFDPFTMKCYENIVELIPITPINFKKEIVENNPDILIVESAWRGKDDLWTNRIVKIRKDIDIYLLDLIKLCKLKKIPTVFWNKEDPVHYKHFIESAKLFDYIFTTDLYSVDKYKEEVNHKNVYQLSFAANPYIHNPIKISNKRIEKACFAGTFYNRRYTERSKNLKQLLKLAIKNIGLEIYDRNYNKTYNVYRFPQEFTRYVKGYLEVDELDKANKGYKIVLNVNSVKNSPTMFSRRVFECLACGTPIISSYSLGINAMFKDIVVSSDNTKDLEEEFKKLKDDEYYDKKALKGIRDVLNNHTYQHRIQYIAEKVKIDVNYKKTVINVISIVNSLEEFDFVISMYKNQDYINKKLYLIIQNQEIIKYIPYIDKEINLIKYDDKTKHKLLKDFIDSDYICFMNSNNYYGKFYINDLANATLYTNAQVIGKKSFYRIEENEGKKVLLIQNKVKTFEYVDEILLDRAIFKSEIVKLHTIQKLVKCITNNNFDININNDDNYLSIDRYNFIENITYELNDLYKDIEV